MVQLSFRYLDIVIKIILYNVQERIYLRKNLELIIWLFSNDASFFLNNKSDCDKNEMQYMTELTFTYVGKL